MHNHSHPLAGHTVVIKNGVQDPAQGMVVGGALYHLEDWWDIVGGGSWQDSFGNFAVMHYKARREANGLPIDDEVVYGKIGSLGHIVHVSELSEQVLSKV